ncbi:MAG: hypothetical protein SO147_00555, partial [Clostridia bacterium]|nr:hypothetical protein [Clostridia bacterium]
KGKTMDGKLYVAVYDEKGCLAGITLQEIPALESGTQVSGTVTVSAPVSSYRAFLWDETLSPLAVMEEEPIQ